MGCPTRVWRRRWTTGCHFAALPVCRWTRAFPTIRRSGASARSWRRTDWPRRCSRRSITSSMPAGLIVRQGTLIDATLLQASVKPPSVKEGPVSERDAEAGWTKKNGKSHFGYKAHVAVDEGSEIIRTAILTSADLHDSQPAAQLIRGDERAVYGDKAYASQALRARLAEAGINDGLMYRAARNKPLKPWQSWFNKAVAAIRAAVERRFGIMKRGYGFRRVRYIGLSRNACHLQLLCTAINLKRALALAG